VCRELDDNLLLMLFWIKIGCGFKKMNHLRSFPSTQSIVLNSNWQ
jgi:hypothetical protein